MNKRILWCFLFLAFISIDISAQNKQTWDYPVKPGSKQWNAYTSYQERLEVCQIPQEILKDIPTEELVAICKNYPFSRNIFAYSSVQKGFEKVCEEFNEYRDLLQREDNVKWLTETLKSDIKKADVFLLSTNLQEIGRCCIDMSITEIFLSSESICKNADLNQLKVLAILSYDMIQKKEKNTRLYGLMSISTITNLFAKTISKLSPKKAQSIQLTPSVNGNGLYTRDEVKALSDFFKEDIESLRL